MSDQQSALYEKLPHWQVEVPMRCRDGRTGTHVFAVQALALSDAVSAAMTRVRRSEARGVRPEWVLQWPQATVMRWRDPNLG